MAAAVVLFNCEFCRSAWPPFTNPGRTYKFYTGKPVLPFGYGLSYSRFLYEILPELSLSSVPVQQRGLQVLGHVAVNVTNAGDFDADEVVLGFISPPPGAARPLIHLFDFARLHVKAGQTTTGSLESRGSMRITRLELESSTLSHAVLQSCCLLPPPASPSSTTPAFGACSCARVLWFPVFNHPHGACHHRHCPLRNWNPVLFLTVQQVLAVWNVPRPHWR